MKKNNVKLFVNLGLLLFGAVMIFSGLVLQIRYHIGNHGSNNVARELLGFNYYEWSDIHKISISIITVLVFLHIVQHWKWYVAICSKKLFRKHTLTLQFTVVFILVAITGFVPWIIALLHGNESIRKVVIEIHDKLALFACVYICIHVIGRRKWIIQSCAKLVNGKIE